MKSRKLVVDSFPEVGRVGGSVCYSMGVSSMVPVDPRDIRSLQKFEGKFH